ncbi:MAG: TPM domain-containing protein [Bdellovibrionales bacterium]|nr:TPM domain-containing protein [Bdellovibrionales bacterium]
MEQFKILLGDAGAGKIEEAVERAEAGSSGELVPVVVERSSAYTFTYWVGAFAGLVFASVAAWVITREHPWFPLEQVFILQFAGGLFGALMVQLLPGLQRWMIPRARMRAEVAETALANFIRHGLMETERRTGVLIFMSVFERRVEILGDKGIHQKVGESFWKEEADLLARGFRDGRALEALLEAIDKLGQSFRTHFPRDAGDRNELSDSVRRGK